ncbi:hypothetical protein COS59_00720 [Candidatus Wolfebacteria bacterium CG03_land_8_20_14_0_80_36_15]|uniref:Uncharacterized protein n=1 Tax=Candidatus Wolfebacteria bacterium CG03_land_8_20_14_0_80_36_15 TaxID=1975067 RepID=A0A2M7B853_9BACT|nr:MAG: hypothetical protein COS59_00720 [Candidatus Wolfebacteria bacterium CG03_land_8_20_14_0_80_36_15]
MFKSNKILFVGLIAVIIILVGILAWQKIKISRPYYAVYLTTGDLYFGELSRFPFLTLSNAWLIQRDPSSQTGELKLTEFKNAFWSPAGTMRLSKYNIVWIAKLSKDSPVVKYIQQGNQLPVSTSTQDTSVQP